MAAARFLARKQEELYSYVTVVDTEDFSGLGTKVLAIVRKDWADGSTTECIPAVRIGYCTPHNWCIRASIARRLVPRSFSLVLFTRAGFRQRVNERSRTLKQFHCSLQVVEDAE